MLRHPVFPRLLSPFWSALVVGLRVPFVVFAVIRLLIVPLRIAEDCPLAAIVFALLHAFIVVAHFDGRARVLWCATFMADTMAAWQLTAFIAGAKSADPMRHYLGQMQERYELRMIGEEFEETVSRRPELFFIVDLWFFTLSLLMIHVQLEIVRATTEATRQTNAYIRSIFASADNDYYIDFSGTELADDKKTSQEMIFY